jgi:SAM-dependent methyltransferase
MGTAEVQGQLWGRHAQTWAEGMERRVTPLFAAMLEALAPLAGKNLLDAGCGAGKLVELATHAGAHATGVDASQGLLEYARDRTPEATFVVGEIEALDQPDASFDIVTAVNSIQYATDPAHAVAELARVCKPGGRVAIGIWGDPARCETEALFARLRSLAPPPPGTPAPLACSDAGVVEDLLTKAGLDIHGGDEVEFIIEFADHVQAWRDHTAAGPLQRVIEVAGEDAVRAVLHDVLEADRKSDGVLRQVNVLRYVVASKPHSYTE